MSITPPPEPRGEALSLRSYYVHLSDGPAAGGHLITDAEDAMEAALLFAERWVPQSGDGDVLRVNVVDGFTGERCCFSIDVGAGEIGPC